MALAMRLLWHLLWHLPCDCYSRKPHNRMPSRHGHSTPLPVVKEVPTYRRSLVTDFGSVFSHHQTSTREA
jgi:hypothetical protein